METTVPSVPGGIIFKLWPHPYFTRRALGLQQQEGLRNNDPITTKTTWDLRNHPNQEARETTTSSLPGGPHK